jgi:translation initiation factor IF-2
MSFSNYKNNGDTVLELFNPLLINILEENFLSVSSYSLEPTTSNPVNSIGPEILQLNLKPSFKLDKKNKKVEKDDELEVNKVRNKLKKKFREKIEFDEEFESIPEEDRLIQDQLDISSLSIQRPVKPKAIDNLTKTKLSTPSTNTVLNKKRKTVQVQVNSKKEFESDLLVKPELVTISDSLTVQELSKLFVVNETEIIKNLFLKGIIVTLNNYIDVQTCIILGQDFGVQVQIGEQNEDNTKNKIALKNVDLNNTQPRPPIITVMGHVDHGKTTLLDKIRKTQVAQKESGGITQKLGAYEVDIAYKEEKRKLVFLDTPGHEAFSGMRNRGIRVADIAVLVVAADDGVRPQTIEAINCIKKAEVPLIVAINKIDKEDANIDNIKQELSTYGLISESWGGDTLMVPISAKQGTNIDALLEMILLLSEVENFTATPESPAEGTILESHIDRTKGPVASILVQNGTLKVGDIFVSKDVIGKIRGIVSSTGDKLVSALPSSPVIIWGLSKPPLTGDLFSVYLNEKEAKLAVQDAQMNLEKTPNISLLKDNSFVSELNQKGVLNLIIKADIQGSLEAIIMTLNKMSLPEVPIKILYASPGEITETDIEFAHTSSAQILSFNTTLAPGANKAAKMHNVLIKQYNVIYDLFDYVQEVIDEFVGPQYDEQFIGSAIVKNIFPLGKSYVAGVKVGEGKIIRSCHIKIVRNNQIVYQGILDSLKRLKDEVLEVKEPLECGIFIKEFDTWQENDVVKAFNLVEKKKIK